MSYNYSDLAKGLGILEQQLKYIDEQTRMYALYLYTKRWQRFYGVHNKYNGKGELRESKAAMGS